MDYKDVVLAKSHFLLAKSNFSLFYIVDFLLHFACPTLEPAISVECTMNRCDVSCAN